MTDGRLIFSLFVASSGPLCSERVDYVFRQPSSSASKDSAGAEPFFFFFFVAAGFVSPAPASPSAAATPPPSAPVVSVRFSLQRRGNLADQRGL